MGNRHRPIGPSTVPAGPIARRGGRHNTIFNIRYGTGDGHVYFYKKVPANQEELSSFVVGRPGPEYGLRIYLTGLNFTRKTKKALITSHRLDINAFFIFLTPANGQLMIPHHHL